MQRPLLLPAGVLLAMVVAESPVFGQLLPPSSDQSSSTAGAGAEPATSNGQTAPSAGGVFGGFVPSVNNAGAAPASGGTGEGGPTTGPALPSDYRPPANPPSIMTNIPNPILTEKEMKKLETDLKRAGGGRGIGTLMLQGEATTANKKLMEQWAKLRVAQLTAAESLAEINSRAKSLFDQMRKGAALQSNRNRQSEFRRAMAEALTKYLGQVLLKNNVHVRLRAAWLLGELNLLEADRQHPSPVAYTPAIEPLLDVLEQTVEGEDAQEALLGVKVLAANGIRKLASHSPTIDSELRYRAADVLIKELAKKDTHPWYQASLAEALAAIELELDRARNPVVMTALMSVISDSTRSCFARAAAAKALSRAPMPPGFDAQAAAEAILAMGREFALNYNRNPDAAHWPICFHYLNLAFVPESDDQSEQLSENSLLAQGALPAPYQTAQQRLAPVIEYVVLQEPGGESRQPIPTELLQPLNVALGGPTATTSAE